jgi:hypothetical protein
MNEYIRKQEAIDVAMEDGKKIPTVAIRIMHDIKAIPAADVVQVVRCDDCVYYGSRRWCELHSSVFDDNAFCSYGERREE